jgi:hypothetical protein
MLPVWVQTNTDCRPLNSWIRRVSGGRESWWLWGPPLLCQVWADGKGWYAVIVARNYDTTLTFIHGGPEWIEWTNAYDFHGLYKKVFVGLIAHGRTPPIAPSLQDVLAANMILTVIHLCLRVGRFPTIDTTDGGRVVF